MSIVNSNQWSAVKDEINNNALPRAGGTLLGNIDAGGNLITNLGAPTNDNDVVNLDSLKTLRPFSMQIISCTLDYGTQPVGDASQTISLNPEFKQNFSQFVFIGIGVYNSGNCFSIPSDGSYEYSITDYLSTYVVHSKTNSTITFNVGKRYSKQNVIPITFLVIGIN